MTSQKLIVAAPFLLLAASLIMIELGYRYRLAKLSSESGSKAGIALVNGTVLSLTGLVLAFSFSSASGRLDSSRKSILDEANAIEAAWVRIDLAENDARHRLKELFRNYVDARIRAYEALPELDEYQRQSRIAANLLSGAWPVAVAGTSVSVNRSLLLTALSSAGDAAAARRLALRTRLPKLVVLFLFGFVLIASLLVGTTLGDAGNRQWLHRLMIATVMSSVVFVILDMEYPRQGAFNLLQEEDAMIVELRRLMR